jgi:hypothetical protein
MQGCQSEPHRRRRCDPERCHRPSAVILNGRLMAGRLPIVTKRDKSRKHLHNNRKMPVPTQNLTILRLTSDAAPFTIAALFVCFSSVITSIRQERHLLTKFLVNI